MASLLCFISCLFLSAWPSIAAVVEHDFTVGWVMANPDGRLERPVIGINGKWPCPSIEASVGDELVVHVHNALGNETTAIHWHGIHQVGTSNMDGAAMTTQCPIQPGSSYTYRFLLDAPGTYWYHAHDGGQYPDGLRGPLIVKEQISPFTTEYDEELVLTFSDWYHAQMPGLINFYLSPERNPSGAEPVPYSALLNDGLHSVLPVEAGKTYLLRIINMAAFAQAYIWIDSHPLLIVEVDGVAIVPTESKGVYLATAQRYAVLLDTKKDNSKNFAITASMDTDKFDHVPAYLDQNVTATLQYAPSLPSAHEVAPLKSYDSLDIVDEMDLVPLDGMGVLDGKPDVSFVMNLSFFGQDNQNRAGFNNITYLSQKVPTLYTAHSLKQYALNSAVYGIHTNPMVVHYGELVEIVINNFDNGAHIMHIHGHAPQIVAKVADIAEFGGDADSKARPYNGDTSHFPRVPLRRDTWILAPNGYTVIQFLATNPGVWLFHCHMEWHVDAGLVGTLIEAPIRIQETQTLDPAMNALCKEQGISIAGNAAGKMGLNVAGQVTAAAPNPSGAIVPLRTKPSTG